jgi:two-component system response regulator GlrR
MGRVLIAEAGAASEAAAIRQFLITDQELSCRVMSWDELSQSSVSRFNYELVIIVASTVQEEILHRLASHKMPVPVLAVLPSDATEEWLNITSLTMDDFIVSPFSALELRQRIGRLLGQPQHVVEEIRQSILQELGLTNLVGRDPVFMQAISQLPRFARSDASVCITGETGTGKELCARALHHLSSRRRFPFIGVDCGAVPDQLFENEMFGHARGAFTDAHRDHRGLIAMAEGGTLFLDEIDSLPLSSQGKLLRFLQDRQFRALGSDRFEAANVRIVAATNRDLESAVSDRQFRSDLFFRLNVLRLRLPPLRERSDDVELLAFAALKDCTTADGGSTPIFTQPALKALSLYRWPGNVRELYNVVQRAVIAAEGGRILPEHLDLPVDEHTGCREAGSDFRTLRAAAVAHFEKQYVEGLLRKHNGNVTHAAREARQDRRAFRRFIRKYNIDRRALIA